MIDIRIKENFFDRAKVQKAVDAATRRELSRAGGLVRTIAKNSIRSSGVNGQVSKPGEPPRSHSKLLKRGILFGYDGSTKSVVVGPVGFRRSKVPALLEFGGSIQVRDKLIPVSEFTVERQTASGRTVRRRKRKLAPFTGRLTYEPRPFMGPALLKAAPKLPEKWRNSVRG